jgi:hypothetical protein
LGTYWDPACKYLHNGYVDVKPHGFQKVERFNLKMEKIVPFEDLLGLLSTWSGLNAYRKANPDKEDPLEAVAKRMEEVLEPDRIVTVAWDIPMVLAWKE